ncbi:MAG: hypothetical protein ACXVB9_20215 [Bdellovibrionota bacterium]
MNTIFVLLIPVLVSLPAFAETLNCRADYDEGSHYEISAAVNGRAISGDVAFRFLSNDGINLHSALKPQTQSFDVGKKIELTARDENMSVALRTDFETGSKDYEGVLTVTFDLQDAQPVDVNAQCTLQ